MMPCPTKIYGHQLLFGPKAAYAPVLVRFMSKISSSLLHAKYQAITHLLSILEHEAEW